MNEEKCKYDTENGCTSLACYCSDKCGSRDEARAYKNTIELLKLATEVR